LAESPEQASIIFMSINLYYTPSRILAIEALATHLCARAADDPLALAQTRVILPYRRTCRELEKALFARSATSSIVLPEIIAIEDIIHLSEIDALPPAPLFLQELLIDTYLQEHGKHLALAMSNLKAFTKEVLTFLTLFYRAQGTAKTFDSLVPDDLALHWQNSWSLIEQLTLAWPRILEEEGYSVPAMRWSQTLDYWSSKPLSKDHYVLGVMGSEPSLKRWLTHVAKTPQGRVILPGFDPLVTGSCQPHHPQYLYQEFLGDLKDHVLNIQEFQPAEVHVDDRFLNRVFSPTILETPRQEAMSAWPNITITEAQDEKTESQIAALIAREALENPDISIAIVCPEKEQGVQIESELKRWNIEVDCFYGTPFKNTPTGFLILQSLDLLKQQKSLTQILDVLKNPLSRIMLRREVRQLEFALRKRDQISELDQHPLDRIDRLCSLESWKYLKQAITHVSAQMTLSAWIQKHLALLELMTQNPETDEPLIWKDEAGEMAWGLFQDLQKHSAHLDNQTLYTLSEYKEYVDRLCAPQEIRRSFTHPRLGIYDTRSALSVTAQHVILVGLNDGVWPSQFNQLPWLSRTMRESLNLPGHDVSKGQEAFSFSQFLTRNRVTITYAKNRSGAPCLMSPWLYRLVALAQFQHLSIMRPAPETVTLMDQATHTQSLPRPTGTPPLAHRPIEISVTDVVLLSSDPYEFYWRKVLKLRPLAPLELSAQPYHYGQWIHHFLDIITRDKMSYETACTQIEQHLPHSIPQRILWRLIVEETLSWLDQENLWPHEKGVSLSETAVHVTNFLDTHLKLRGVIDRVDLIPHTPVLYDYKTGGLPTEKSFKNGDALQLPLLLHLYEHMNHPTKIHGIGYIGLKDQSTLIQDETLSETLTKAIENTRQLLTQYLVQENPFPAPYTPLNDDAQYFSRLQEWHHGA